MPDPEKYHPHFNYSGWEAAVPKSPKPGAELDNDFANIERSIDETIDALKDIRRSDGKLKNGIVDKDAPDESSRELWESAEVAAQSAVGAAASASTSAELARGYANDAVSQGNVPIYASAATVQGLEIPAGISALRTNGYYSPGDGKGSLYVESDASSGTLQSGDGRWWVEAAVRDHGTFSTVADVENSHIPPVLESIRTNGYTTLGDGGGALYKRVASEPSHNSKVQSADGSWWVPVVPDGYAFDSVSDMQASRLVTPGARVRTLGYYEPGDGGGCDYEIVAAGTGTDDGGSFIDLSGSGLQAKGLFGSEVSILQYGAVVGGDNTNVFSLLSSGLSSFSGTIKAPPGRFYTNGSLNIPAEASFVGAGKGLTIIDAEGSTDIFDNFSVVNKLGEEPTSLPDLSDDVSEGDILVEFSSAHGMVAGDAFLIYNPNDFSFSEFRPGYRNGEFCTVREVISSTSVFVEKPLYASHDASEVKVYSMAMPARGAIRGMTIIAPGPSTTENIQCRALRVEYGIGVYLSDLKVSNGGNITASLERSYRSKVDIEAYQPWDDGELQYGLVIGNCQEIDITGFYMAGRHAIEQGGGVRFTIPCRDIHVHDFIAISRNGASAGDWHGNVEWSSFRGGTLIGGGLNIAGDHNSISDCTIRVDDDRAIQGREILGCDHVVSNVKIYTKNQDAFRGGAINVGGNEASFSSLTKRGGTFKFSDIQIYSESEPSYSIVVRNHGYSGDPWDVVLDGITIINTGAQQTEFPAILVRMNTEGVGDDARSVSATNITVPEGYRRKIAVSQMPATLVKQDSISGSLVLTTNDAVDRVFEDVEFDLWFAKTPTINVTIDRPRGPGGVGRNVAGVGALSASESGFRAEVLRADSDDNFAGSQDINVYWQASLSEI